jgi:hypothetical protein
MKELALVVVLLATLLRDVGELAHAQTTSDLFYKSYCFALFKSVSSAMIHTVTIERC